MWIRTLWLDWADDVGRSEMHLKKQLEVSRICGFRRGKGEDLEVIYPPREQ